MYKLILIILFNIIKLSMYDLIFLSVLGKFQEKGNSTDVII